MLFDNQHQLIVGNPRLIRKRALSRHKNDRRDAQHIFELLMRGEFPELWRRPPHSGEILEVIRLRHNLVKQRTQTANRLQALAHEAGLPPGKIKSVLFQAALKAVDFGANFAFRREVLFEIWEQTTAEIKKLELWLQTQWH